jgi:site-specific DNA-methyltransferase (adenine-specific)
VNNKITRKADMEAKTMEYQSNNNGKSNSISQQRAFPANCILCGDCVQVMRQLPARSVDFVLTDPPYLVNYCDRSGRSIQNDSNAGWLRPAFMEAYRVLRQDSFMVAFYSWTKVDKFMDAWRCAGFRAVGHLVFRKTYSSKARFLKYRHEQAYLLAKGQPTLPENPIADVIDMPYSGNTLHPTQKPVTVLLPLIQSFSQAGSLVLDPFCGSGSTLLAAKQSRRRYLGIELDAKYHAVAVRRLATESCSSVPVSIGVYPLRLPVASSPQPPLGVRSLAQA